MKVKCLLELEVRIGEALYIVPQGMVGPVDR